MLITQLSHDSPLLAVVPSGSAAPSTAGPLNAVPPSPYVCNRAFGCRSNRGLRWSPVPYGVTRSS
jgi:hypothetical protein